MTIRYRTLSPEGDYTFGQGASEFLIDTPEAVIQAVKTRLALWAGEWFLDLTEGTPYLTDILGVGTQATYDTAIQERILGTPGVAAISDYSSSLVGRRLSVSAKVKTIFGDHNFSGVIA
jgi:hypothetical protein